MCGVSSAAAGARIHRNHWENIIEYDQVFDAQAGPLADGQRTIRTWLVNSVRVTKGQAAEHRAVQALARSHPVLLAGLAEGWVVHKSVALQLARWTRPIPDEYRDEAEEVLIAAARAGADLRALAADLRRDPLPDRPA